MLQLNVADLCGVDVHASEAEARAGALIEVTMQAYKRRLPGHIDRAMDKRHEVEVADAGNIVAHRQRSRHKRITNPTEGRQPIAELFDDKGRGRHGLESREPPRDRSDHADDTTYGAGTPTKASGRGNQRVTADRTPTTTPSTRPDIAATDEPPVKKCGPRRWLEGCFEGRAIGE